MSFKTAFDDFMDRRKKIDRSSIPPGIPLQQGRTYLRDRSRMCKGLRKNLTLIEGFEDQAGSNVVAGETHTADTYNTNYTQPVADRNKKEFDELQQMQNSFLATQSAWKNQYQHVLTLVKGQPAEMKRCLQACKGKKGVDSISACMYGCNTGKFSSQGPTSRTTQNPGPPPWWAIFADAISAVAAPELLAGALATTAITSAVEGFTPNAPPTTGQASDSIPTSVNVMGTYGPTGFGKGPVGRAVAGNIVNTMLGSTPQKGDWNMLKQFDNTEGWEFTGGDPDSNPGSLLATKQNAVATAAINLSKELSNDPLVQQMQNTNIDATNIGPYVEKLRSKWKDIFNKSCKYAIGGFGNIQAGSATVDTGQFAGHTQNCKSWVNTAEDRSGFYSVQAGASPYSVDSSGKKIPFASTPIALANTGEKGCDTVIPSTRASNSEIGGSGYCVCADGTYAGYADAGHGTFTCNQVCAPQNKTMRSHPLFHNSKKLETGVAL